jgi:hypothetical protein
MIRFLPDTWRDALLRPLAMASPDGGVYVEIIAPDFRFLFVLALLLALAGYALFRRGALRPPLRILLALTALAFVPWLATSGNGRYFIPYLLIAGPLCIALVQSLPASRSLRAALALLMVAWQGVALYENDPWRWWGHVAWQEGPAFQVAIPPEVAAQPATYVTLASISYSILAPRFHPDSRWINISAQRGLGDNSPDGLRTQALIAAPGPLRLLFPSVPGGESGEQIGVALGVAINDLIARQGLSIQDVRACRLLRSAGLADMASRRVADEGTEALHGFWLCPLVRHAAPSRPDAGPPPAWIEDVFAKLEKTCPHIFRAGEAVSLRIPAGAVRGYPGSDFKLYVLTDGQVLYKYFRALNPVLVGEARDIMAPGFTMDCNNVKGRSGLPWERAI